MKTCKRHRLAREQASAYIALLLLIGVFVPAVNSFSTRRIQQNDKTTTSSFPVVTPTALSMTATVSTGSSTDTVGSPVPIGRVGNWEYLHGNWVLRPSSTEEVPRAVLHFLGGALVGASPHITYRYMLERLAEKGFLVIATPYQLSFDHLQTCDQVITKFEQMAPSIARQYGALPVVGIGHSCGALLQLLITSLFPDTPRAANALLSFNNKPVNKAVPFFEEVFAPFFTSIGTKNATGSATSNDVLRLYLKIARAATEGESIEKIVCSCGQNCHILMFIFLRRSIAFR